MSYYQVEERPLAALAHSARKARYGGRLRQGQRRAQLRAARRSAPLAVRCPRRRSNRAATGIRGTAAGQVVAVCSRSAAARPALFAGGPACGPCQPRRLSLRCPPALRPPPPLRGARGSSARRSRPAQWAGLARPRRPRPLARVALLPAAALVAALRGRSSSAGPPRAPSRCSRRLSGRRGGFGALRSGGQGRARPAAASPRLRPRPLWPMSRCLRSLVALWLGGVLPPYPPRPLPPLGAKGSAKPAASLRRDGRPCAAAHAYSRPSPRCRCQPPPARRGPRARLTIRKLSTARFAAQRAPHFLPL